MGESREQVIEYYLPLANANQPDALVGKLLKVTDGAIRRWFQTELDTVFPKAKELIKKMSLEERYKDVTYETLNQKGFLDSVKHAFPQIDWDKAYNEFLAAGEAVQGRETLEE